MPKQYFSFLRRTGNRIRILFSLKPSRNQDKSNDMRYSPISSAILELLSNTHTYRQTDKQTHKVKTEDPLTSGTDGLPRNWSNIILYIHYTYVVLHWHQPPVKGQSLLVENLASTDRSLLWQIQQVSRFTQLRKEYDTSIYAKHLIWEI